MGENKVKRFKKLFIILICFAFISVSIPLNLFARASTDETAIPISTLKGLNDIRNDLSGNYYLTKNLVFSDADFAEGGAFYNNGEGWEPIGTESKPFTGHFNGNGYAVSGLKENITSNKLGGLFGYNSGIIENTKLISANIIVNSTQIGKCGAFGGIVAGYNTGKIMYCDVSGNIEITCTSTSYNACAYSGGICGRNAGEIYNCSSGCSLEATTYTTGGNYSGNATFVGGIVGLNISKISKCVNFSVNISCFEFEHDSKTPGDQFVGGIVGMNRTSTAKVIDCMNYADIVFTVNKRSDGNISIEGGGISGINCYGGRIEGCINYGNINFNKATSTGFIGCLGGICGVLDGEDIYDNKYNIEKAPDGKLSTYIVDCKNFGDISSNVGYVSGIVANSTILGYSYIQKCENHGNIKGVKNISGISSLASNITKCSNFGDISSTSGHAAGISVDSNNVSLSQNSGNVTISNSEMSCGAIVAECGKTDSISNCFNTFPGLPIYDYSYKTPISACYTIYNDTTGYILQGPNTFSDNSRIELTISEMKTKSSYISHGFDFSSVWAIDPEINDGFPYFAFIDSAKKTLDTYEKYEFLAKNYPEYLNNEKYNRYLYSCASICNDVLQQYNGSDDFLLSYAETFVNLDSIILKNFAGALGLSDTTEDEWLEKNALEFLRLIQESEDVLYESWDEVEQNYKDFKFLVKDIDLIDSMRIEILKEDFIEGATKLSKCMKKADAEKVADEIITKRIGGVSDFFTAVDQIVDVADLLLFSMQMLDVEVTTLEKLQENIDENTPLYKAITVNLSEIKENPAEWIIKKYLVDTIVDELWGLLESAGDWSAGQLAGSNISLAHTVVKTISKFLYNYVYQGAKIDDIYGAIVAYDFYSTTAISNKELLNDIFVCKMNGIQPDVKLLDNYKFMFEARRTAMQNYVSACSDINKYDEIDPLLESIKKESYANGLLNFETYIETCFKEYSAAIENGEIECQHGVYHIIGYTKATCTIEGGDNCVCDVCGVDFKRNVISAFGHNYGEWQTRREPTPTIVGMKIRICSLCGGSEYQSIPKIEALFFDGASITLEDNIAVNYRVPKSLFEVTGYKNPYIVFETDGRKTVVRKYIVDGDMYIFTFDNIAPDRINDKISATIYATYNGTEYTSETKEYSVADYCYNMLEECSDDKYAELRTLLVDLLNFGANTQAYTGHNKANLANSKLTEEQKAWGTTEKPSMESVLDTKFAVIDNPQVKWKGAGLSLDTTVAIRYKFTAESIENIKIKVASETKEWIIPSNKIKKENGFYYVYFDGLVADQMREKVYITAYNGETAVSNTVCYSIESYAYDKQNSNVENLSPLVISMMKYGNSAYNYTH